MLGDRIRTFRQARGWSQRELARRSTLTRSGLRHLEDGLHPRPYIESVVLVAAAFNMSVEDLIGDPGNLALSAVRADMLRSLSMWVG